MGAIAQPRIGAFIGATLLGAGACWGMCLEGAAVLVLTFLVGAELDPKVLTAGLARGGLGRAGQFCKAVPGLCRPGLLGPGLVGGRELAGGPHPFRYLGGCGLRVRLAFGLNATDYGKIMLVGTLGKGHALVHRLSTLTCGLLDPLLLCPRRRRSPAMVRCG